MMKLTALDYKQRFSLVHSVKGTYDLASNQKTINVYKSLNEKNKILITKSDLATKSLNSIKTGNDLKKSILVLDNYTASKEKTKEKNEFVIVNNFSYKDIVSRVLKK